MEKLALEVFERDGSGSKFAFLDDDTSISITVISPIFGKGDIWSWDFKLDITANAHIFGSSAEIHGSRLHEVVHKRRVRLWVDGLPLYYGYLVLDKDADVDADGSVDVRFEGGGKTFDARVDGVKANQVPLLQDVEIGMALWRERITEYYAYPYLSPTIKPTSAQYGQWGGGVATDSQGGAVPIGGTPDKTHAQKYPRQIYPKGSFENKANGQTISINDVNTDSPYDDEQPNAHPFCNVSLCYQRYGYEKKDTAGNIITDYNSDPEKQRGYEVAPAMRTNSAPNFYVMYWLRALLTHLGIQIDENQMQDVEDLRRLFFVNTNCDIEVPDHIGLDTADNKYGYFRHLGNGNSRFISELFWYNMPMIDVTKSALTVTNYTIHPLPSPEYSDQDREDYPVPGSDVITGMTAKINPYAVRPEGGGVFAMGGYVYYSGTYQPNNVWPQNSYLHRAFATSQCFPDEDISKIIDTLENAFGIRFLFDSEYKRVRIVLIKNLLRSNEIQEVPAKVYSVSKTESNIKGFRLTYGKGDDETQFYYKGFASKLAENAESDKWVQPTDNHDYSQWKLDASYAAIQKKVSAFDVTCYVTPETGNAYVIKVDQDAKRYEELFPSLFEGAGFMDAEDGDCTGDSDTIEEINVGFTPAIMNDVNTDEERATGTHKQVFALFVGEEMMPRRIQYKDEDYNAPDKIYPLETLMNDPAVPKAGTPAYIKPGEFAIMSDSFVQVTGLKSEIVRTYTYTDRTDPFHPHEVTKTLRYPVTFDVDGYLNEGYRLYLQDNFKPNDDGISPLEKVQWGLTLGIMRGSGTDSAVDYSRDVEEEEGNDTWEIRAGSSATAHHDTCDNYGEIFDYTPDGQSDPQDTTGRFSLKLRAEKPNPYYDPSLPESETTNPRYLQIDNAKLRGRGIMDTFYPEYSHWVRNARVANQDCDIDLATLLNIDLTKRARIGDVTGFIKKMQYNVHIRTGLSKVNVEMMYI